MQYHYADGDNQVIGPVSVEDLQTLYRSGAITADTNVLPEGESDWRAYRLIASVPVPPTRGLEPIVQTARLAPSQIPTATQKCPFCAEEISIEAKKCKHCGETIDVALRAAEEAKRSNEKPMVFMNAGGGAAAAAESPRPVVVVANTKSGLLAAFLNLIFPGLGYMYCGRIFIGLIALVVTVVVAVATDGVGMVVMWPILIIDGFLAAGRANRRIVVVS